MKSQKPLIFDIGANRGDFSQKYFDTCTVVAVEPNSSLIECLKQRFVSSKVFIEPCAVSDKISTIDFFICSIDQQSSCNKNWLTTMRYKNDGISNTVHVVATTLDSLIEKYGEPFHIKIDVEGYELEVVSGLSKRVGSIQFEYIIENFEDMSVPVIQKLQQLGYDKFYVRQADGDFNPFDISEPQLTAQQIIEKQCFPAKMGGMILASC